MVRENRLMKSLGYIAAQAFGQTVAKELLKRLGRSLLQKQKQEARRRTPPTAVEIKTYLSGSTFAPFLAPRVEGWAAEQLEDMGSERASLVFQAASGGLATEDTGKVINNIVRYLAQTKIPGFEP